MVCTLPARSKWRFAVKHVIIIYQVLRRAVACPPATISAIAPAEIMHRSLVPVRSGKVPAKDDLILRRAALKDEKLSIVGIQ